MSLPADAAGFIAWSETRPPSLTSAVAATLADRPLAEEVVAEAFARAYARWRRVSAMDSPDGWIVRVALNQARGRFRRLATQRKKAHLLAPDEVAPTEPGDHALWDAVRELPERTRTAVVLRYVADLPEADVARAMGVSRGTVATTLSRARHNLAEQLKGEEV